MKFATCLILFSLSFIEANAEEFMAPELHRDPFINPLVVEQKKATLSLNETDDQVEQALRSALLWKPELRGIIRSSDIAIVNIDGNMISMGEQLEGYRLIKVKERSVVFEKNGTHYPLSLDSSEDASNIAESTL